MPMIPCSNPKHYHGGTGYVLHNRECVECIAEQRDRYLCALDRIATPGYCPDPQAEAAMVLGRIPKD